jgi:hypothetical protein
VIAAGRWWWLERLGGAGGFDAVVEKDYTAELLATAWGLRLGVDVQGRRIVWRKRSRS